MAERLSDRLVRALPAPESGSKIYYDSELAGFAARITAAGAAGARAFILRYRSAAAAHDRRLPNLDQQPGRKRRG
jgi:hypothetical protein